MRLVWAVAGGCVPILASSAVSPFFDDAIDYHTFAMTGVPKHALRTLHEVLDSMPEDKLQAMHTAALAHRRLLLWGVTDSQAPEGGGYAYNVTMHELCWRAAYRPIGVRCEGLLPKEAARLIIPPPLRPSSRLPAARVSGTVHRRAWWKRASKETTA